MERFIPLAKFTRSVPPDVRSFRSMSHGVVALQQLRKCQELDGLIQLNDETLQLCYELTNSNPRLYSCLLKRS